MDNIKNYLNDLEEKKRYETENRMVKTMSKFYNVKVGGDFYPLEANIDGIVDIIIKAKKMDGYTARSFSTILQRSLKQGYSFKATDPNKSAKIEKRFNDIMYRSNYLPRLFVREVLKNLIQFSNAFIYKKVDKIKGKIDSLLILPSYGWRAKETAGPKVLKWTFNMGDTSVEYSSNDIIHLHYNKETHEVFGIPFIQPVLEDLQLLRELETAALEDYYNSLKKKVVVYVGDNNRPGTTKEIDEITDYIDGTHVDEDWVINGRAKVDVVKVDFKEPTGTLSNMRSRCFTGLQQSDSQMGISGAGRQDADTQDKKSDIIVEDFQETLEDQLNISIVKDLVMEEFGEYNDDTAVQFGFNQNFNDLERKEKHNTLLFQSGVIDHDEVRNSTGKNPTKFDKAKSFHSMYPTRPPDGSTQAPTNQHGKTSTTKPSVKN